MLACCDGYSPESGIAGSGESGGHSSGKIQDEWKALMYMDHAVIDKDSAWLQIKSITQQDGFGTGGSKTNSLYWVASRLSSISSTNKNSCPTETSSSTPGVMLGCCPV